MKSYKKAIQIEEITHVAVEVPKTTEERTTTTLEVVESEAFFIVVDQVLPSAPTFITT